MQMSATHYFCYPHKIDGRTVAEIEGTCWVQATPGQEAHMGACVLPEDSYPAEPATIDNIEDIRLYVSGGYSDADNFVALKHDDPLYQPIVDWLETQEDEMFASIEEGI